MPHSHTLSKWYSHVDAKHGFTDEAFKMFDLNVKCSNNPVVCNLMLEEMAICQHIEFYGTNYYGF